MMFKQFLDRENELGTLNTRYKSNRAEFSIIYGRRRIGKSRLIDEFIQKKKGARLLAREESEHMTLKRFSKNLANLFEDDTLSQTTLPDWDSFFEYISKKTKKDRYVIAIDEFPYLVEQNSTFPSILQDHWDRSLSQTLIFLIICGSSVSVMEDVMGHKSPLYGRRTSQMLIKTIPFFELYRGSDIDLEKAIKFYSVFGGTPPYFTEADLTCSLKKNLVQKVLRSDSFLLQDVEFVLRSELRRPHLYLAILTAIAEGKTTTNEIVNYTGIERSKVGRYLSILKNLKLIKREVPVTEDKVKSRRGIYKLEDNFFRFWFRFIYPNQIEIERGHPKRLAEKVVTDLSTYIGPLFEEICTDFIWNNYEFNKVGGWWWKEHEIDIVALNEDNKEIMLGECKWSENVNAKKLYHDLKIKSEKVRWKNEERKEKYVLFAKSFKDDFSKDDLTCIDLEQMESAM